jgi:hypothetical protein
MRALVAPSLAAAAQHQLRCTGYLTKEDDREPGSDRYLREYAPSAAPGGVGPQGFVCTLLAACRT